MQAELEEYRRKLPEIRDRVEKYSAEIQATNKEIARKNDEIKSFDSKIIKAEIKLAELSEAVVTDEDYNDRIDKIKALERELNELRDVAEHIRSSNVGSSAKNNELTNTLDIIKKVLDEQQTAHYEELM